MPLANPASLLLLFLLHLAFLTLLLFLLNGHRLIRYHEVIIVESRLLILFLGPYHGAAVLFVPLTHKQSLSVDYELVPDHLLHSFHYCYLEN